MDNKNKQKIEVEIAADASKSETWPGERRMEAEIEKAVDAVHEACLAWGDARDEVRSFKPDDEGYTSALAALIRAKAAVGGAMAASKAVAAIYDEMMGKAQGKPDREASERAEEARKDALLPMISYESAAVTLGPGGSPNMKRATVSLPANEGEPPLDAQDPGRTLHLPDGQEGT